MTHDEAFRKILNGIADSEEDIRKLDVRLQERGKLNAIVAIYDSCKNDPDAKIPTKLAVIIEAARAS